MVSPILTNLRYHYPIILTPFSLLMELLSILTHHLMVTKSMTLITIPPILIHPAPLFIYLRLEILFARWVRATFSTYFPGLLLCIVYVPGLLITCRYRTMNRCLLFVWRTISLAPVISHRNPFIQFHKAIFKDITSSSHLSIMK